MLLFVHSHSHRNLVIWGKPCRRFSLQVKRQLSQVQEVATEARFLGGKKFDARKKSWRNPAKQFIWLFVCWYYWYYICVYIYIWIWNPMEMRYSPIINGMLMFFVGVFFFLTAGCQKSQRSGTENGAGGWEHPKWIMDHWLDSVVGEYT